MPTAEIAAATEEATLRPLPLASRVPLSSEPSAGLWPSSPSAAIHCPRRWPRPLFLESRPRFWDRLACRLDEALRPLLRQDWAVVLRHRLPPSICSEAEPMLPWPSHAAWPAVEVTARRRAGRRRLVVDRPPLKRRSATSSSRGRTCRPRSDRRPTTMALPPTQIPIPIPTATHPAWTSTRPISAATTRTRRISTPTASSPASTLPRPTSPPTLDTSACGRTG